MLAGGAFGYLADYLLWWLLYVSLVAHTWCFFRCFPRARYRKAGLAAGNGLVFLCLLGFAALLGETYLRFVAVGTDAFGLSLPARRWFILHTRLNSLGCRDEEWPPDKPPGVYRIAVVGDSFTYGWGIEREADRFTELLEERLNRTDDARIQHSAFTIQHFEVFNVAKPGWDTGAQVEPIRRLIERYAVDEVVLGYVPNDIEKLLPVSGDFDPVRPPMPALFNPETSCLLDFMYWRLYVPRAATVAGYFDWLAEGFGDDATWRLHQQQLGAIAQLCRDRGVTLRVALLPFLRTTGEKYRPDRLHAMLRRFFEANGASVIDLLPVIADLPPEELVVNAGDAHPNERAHALFAEAIWQAFYARR